MSRKNSYNVDDLIENPGSIIESLIADEILVERDLKIDSISGSDIVIDGSVNNTPVNSDVNDYYNGALIVNVDKSERYNVSDYVGGSNTFTMASTPTGWAAGDNVYIKNIRASEFIDTDSFDVVSTGTIDNGTTTSASAGKLVDSSQNFSSTVLPGMVVKNTTDTTYSYVKSVDSNTQLTLMDDIMGASEDYIIYGTRGGWKFRRSLTAKQNSLDILRQLCYESNTMLFRAYKKYRLVSLEGGNVVGTLDAPDTIDGQVQIFPELTSLLDVHTDFTLNYGYDYAKKRYAKRLFVNKNSTSDAALDELKTNCAAAEVNYKIKKKWEYSSDWIDDDSTAIYFLTMMVQKLTYQRMFVRWTGSFNEHFKYEVGDKVLLNYGTMLPYGKNNSTTFLIVGKVFSFKKKTVELTLLY